MVAGIKKNNIGCHKHCNSPALPPTDECIECANDPKYPCFYDPKCKNGGLGCNAKGKSLCRFCGFGDYSSIPCPNNL